MVAYPGVEQHPAARMLDQVTGDAEVARPASAWREARGVIEMDVAAVKHIHPLDTGLLLCEGRLRQADERDCQCPECCVNERAPFHVFLPLVLVKPSQFLTGI